MGLDFASHLMGICHAPDSMRVPYGAYDHLLLPEGRRRCEERTFPRHYVRTFHSASLYSSYLRDNRTHLAPGRRCRYGRHIQLALYSLAPEHRVLHSVYGVRRIVFRSIRNRASVQMG